MYRIELESCNCNFVSTVKPNKLSFGRKNAFVFFEGFLVTNNSNSLNNNYIISIF